VMPTLRKIACIAILCLIFGASNAEIKTVWEKRLMFPDTQLYFPLENLLKDNSEHFDSFTYALCETNEDKSEKICKVVLETKDHTERFCDVTLKVSKGKDYKIFEEMKMTQYGPENIMLLWEEHDEGNGNIKANVVDMSNCQTEEVMVYASAKKYHIRRINMIAYNDTTIDLVMQCGEYAQLCKTNINAQGKIVTFTKPWTTDIISEAYVNSAIHHSKSKGYLMYSKGAYKYHKLYSVKDNGKWKLLKQSQDRLGPSLLSTGHGMISSVATYTDFRILGNNKVFIWRFDVEGNLKLDKTVKFSNFILYSDIQNLADGGFLLLTVECQGTVSSDCKLINDMTYRVKKFGADGNQTGTLEFPETRKLFSNNYTTPSFGLVRVFEKEAKEYCLSFVTGCVACTRGLRGPSHLEIVVECFSDSDFSV
ncbi:hypothetical protein TSAR_013795, partial [Trichomalopsis sarcophagae]